MNPLLITAAAAAFQWLAPDAVVQAGLDFYQKVQTEEWTVHRDDSGTVGVQSDQYMNGMKVEMQGVCAYPAFRISLAVFDRKGRAVHLEHTGDRYVFVRAENLEKADFVSVPVDYTNAFPVAYVMSNQESGYEGGPTDRAMSDYAKQGMLVMTEDTWVVQAGIPTASGLAVFGEVPLYNPVVQEAIQSCLGR